MQRGRSRTRRRCAIARETLLTTLVVVAELVSGTRSTLPSSISGAHNRESTMARITWSAIDWSPWSRCRFSFLSRRGLASQVLSFDNRGVGALITSLLLAVGFAAWYYSLQDTVGHALAMLRGSPADIAAANTAAAEPHQMAREVAENVELVYRASSMLLLLAAVRDGLG